MDKGRRITRNFLYAFFSNTVGLILSVVISFALPVFFGEDIASYGYIQLYMLYASYYYFFHFGLCDGIFLREGGNHYQKLDKRSYSAQLLFLMISQLLITTVILLYSRFLVSEGTRQFVFAVVGVSLLIMQPKTMFTSILQATNRIREYSVVVVLAKVTTVVLLFVVFLSGVKDYRLIILIIVFGEMTSLIYAMYCCKEVVFCKPVAFSKIMVPINENIRSGINLLFSNLSAMLITGIVKFAIEYQWDIEAFARISLTLSVSNMFMVFISAVSVVLYPEMRRMDKDRFVPMYNFMRTMLMSLLLGALVLYYPLRISLTRLLPQYSESISYMAILLPICVYSSRMSMLTQTYMKVLRLEKRIMLVNTGALVLSCFLTVISVFIVKDLTMAIMTVVVSQAYRAIHAEIILSKHIEIGVKADVLYETIITAVFIIANWFIGGKLGLFLYLATYVCYLFVKRNSLKSCVVRIVTRFKGTNLPTITTKST